MKTALQMKLRGFFTAEGKFLPNGSNIVFADVNNLQLTDSLNVSHNVSKEEMKSYLMSHCNCNPVPDETEKLIDGMLAARKSGAKYAPPTVFAPPASHLKAEMHNEVITAEKRCDVLVGRIHNLQDDLKNQPNNHSILGSAKHVNQLLLEILELLNG